jgi:hypothetical protein
MKIRIKLLLSVVAIIISIPLLISGCSRQTLKVTISEAYYLRNNYVDEDLIFDIYIAEITLENTSAETLNFVDKHVEDGQGRTYNANFTYEEDWGESCSSVCSSDAKYLFAGVIKPGYFELVGEMPIDATVLRAYIETETELLVFSLPAPGELEIKEVIIHSEE